MKTKKACKCNISESNQDSSSNTLTSGQQDTQHSKDLKHSHKYKPRQRENDISHRYIQHESDNGGCGRVRRLSERRKRRRRRNYISPCVKCLLFSFNFLFWVAGIGVSGIGFWIIVEKDRHIRDAFDVFFDPSILLFIAGVIIFTLGFLGCLGALRENIHLLKTFHILLTAILVLEVIAAVWVFVFYFLPEARHLVGRLGPEEVMKKAIIRYRDDDDLRDMIDAIQREFECCGVSHDDDGFRDWQDNAYFNCSDDNPSMERCAVPYSCCKATDDELPNTMCGYSVLGGSMAQFEVESVIHTQGCLKGFGLWLERNTIIIGAVCMAIVIPQIMGICLARNLIDQIEMQKSQWRY